MAQRGEMNRDKVIPPIRVTAAEQQEIQKLAQSVGLSTSEYMRSASLLLEINSRFDNEIIIKLFRLNADQARLGNLLKLTLDTLYEYEDREGIRRINELLLEISATQLKIKEEIINV